MKRSAHFLALLTVAGCAVDVSHSDAPDVDDFDGKADEYTGPRALQCTSDDGTAIEVVITPAADTFELTADSLFTATGQRPSLDVQIADAAGAPNEFVDFRPSGLEALPSFGSPRLEIALADGPKALTYGDGTTSLQCHVRASRLLAFLGIAPTKVIDVSNDQVVGFDIDDTLLFSTPAFGRAFATGGTPAPTDVTFWTQANGCDPGCDAETITLANGAAKQLPANMPSGVKESALALVELHRSLGHEVYAITARPDINGAPLRGYIESQLGIPADHVFFEPDLDQPGNPAGKTDRMHQLQLDVFYGDSDSDITDARKAGVRGVRFERSPMSSNRKDGRLAKYHPGYYGETIVANSYE